MTAATRGMPTRPRTALARWVAGPRQGWSSLVLLLVMLAATGLAIDGSRWMGVGADGNSQTAMLPWLMVAAGITGALLASSRLTLGWVDLVAAIVGTAAGLLLASAAVSDAPTLVGRLHELDDSLAAFLQDVLVRGSRSHETSAFLLTVSALAWTSGVFAAISIFRRSNAAGAIAAIGAVMIFDVLATHRPQDLWLVVFAGASLLLVLRLDLEAQRDRWQRRRMVGGQGVGGLFLRGGATVVGLMLMGSLLLASVAGTSSVTAAFPQLDATVADLASRLQELVGVAPGAPGGGGGVYPDRRAVSQSWTTDDTPVFVAEPADGGRHYWRGAAYDAFDGRVWSMNDRIMEPVSEGDDLLVSSTDTVGDGSLGHVLVQATITSKSLEGHQLPAPQGPVRLDRDAQVSLMGEGGPFQFLEASVPVERDHQYSVVAYEPAIGDTNGIDGLTINRVNAGDHRVPDAIRPFLVVKPGSTGLLTDAAAARIKRDQKPGQRDAYHLAQATQDYLANDPHFHYQVDIRNGVCLPGETVPECLLRSGKGFCQQYATTMVMILRTMGIPARYVEGYLPGMDIGEGQFEVDASAAHAWVEVWFNEVGWVPFDPTPAKQALTDLGQVQTELPQGAPIESPRPGESQGPDATDGLATADPNESALPSDAPEPSPAPEAGVGATTDDGVPPAALLALGGAGSALLILGGGAWLWFRRFPGGGPDLAWRGVTGLATRLGFGPRPSQTPYEYSVTLSQVVPRVARDLRVVADAKVESSYSGPTHPARPVGPLRDAYRRSRAGLLRLLFRRGR